METSRPRPVLFWLVTGLLAFGKLAGATAQLLRAQINVDGMHRLGYPLSVLTLVGAWKVVDRVVILLPGWRLAKEWAYAGFFFLLTGAGVSHLASGEGPLAALAPFVFAGLTVASWQLPPASRRLAPAPTRTALAPPTADFAGLQTQPQPLK